MPADIRSTSTEADSPDARFLAGRTVLNYASGADSYQVDGVVRTARWPGGRRVTKHPSPPRVSSLEWTMRGSGSRRWGGDSAGESRQGRTPSPQRGGSPGLGAVRGGVE